MKLFLGIAHAAFAPEREVVLSRLLTGVGVKDPHLGYHSTTWQIDASTQVHVECDHLRSGAWVPSRRAMQAGLESDADYILIANDDMLPCEDFFVHVRRVLEAAEERRIQHHPIAFYANHDDAVKVAEDGGGLYTTHDGLVGVCYALSKDAARHFLAWHDRAMVQPMLSSDTPICYWAMAHRKLIYHTSPSLVDHQCPDASLRDHNHHGFRKAAVPPPSSVELARIDWNREPFLPRHHAGLRYRGTHWKLLCETRPETWDIEASFLAERRGTPLTREPSVFMATMAYTPPEPEFLAARDAMMYELRKRKVLSTYVTSNGDADVARGRNVILFEFLRSPATHLLMIDRDIQILEPSHVYDMLQTGHDVIGGACPRRDGTGQVAANPRPEDMKSNSLELDEHGCVKVERVGTGFLMISRKAILSLMQKHPELLYLGDTPSHRGIPMWGLFQSTIADRRWFSEDFTFCNLWRASGGEVFVYAPASFVHWGKYGYRGTIQEAWGIKQEAGQ